MFHTSPANGESVKSKNRDIFMRDIPLGALIPVMDREPFYDSEGANLAIKRSEKGRNKAMDFLSRKQGNGTNKINV